MLKFLMACALLIPTLFPILQFVLNERNHVRMKNTIEIVHRHVQIARTEGYFTPANIDAMKNELVSSSDVPIDEIQVLVTTTPKYRFDNFDQREMIEYDVKIPIHRILALANYFGITDANNQSFYQIKGSAPSEVLPP